MRTPKKVVIKKISKILRDEHPDYFYLRDLFKKIREEFDIQVTRSPKRLPYVPTEEDLKQYYHIVWQTRNVKHMLLIKILLYTGIRVQELVNVKLEDIDFDHCQIRIHQGKGNKDRIVPFPNLFKETLELFVNAEQRKGGIYLFESNRKQAFTIRWIRKILVDYSINAGLQQSISAHKLRHFLFTWLKKHGLDEAFIQFYSGHAKRDSLEIYSKLSLADAQDKYNDVIRDFPI